MIRLMYKCRGAVSIFLIIVMVPMLVVSSIFVDTGRIQLARAVAASAGDLTLNTALTDYDSVLKDMYGLFATSQDIDDLLVNLEDYYKKAIIAAGVDEVAADDYVGQMLSFVRSSTGTDDLMRMEVSDFAVQKPTTANLANPSITKAQIVEFMKYRAPLHLGASFFEALENLKTLNAQTQMLDDKNKFYEAEQSVLENLEKAWKEIQKYQYGSADKNFPTGDYISAHAKDLVNEVKTFEKDYVPNLIKYLIYYSEFKHVESHVMVKSTPDGEEWTLEGHRTHPAYKAYPLKDQKSTVQEVMDDLGYVYISLGKVQDIQTDENGIYHYIKELAKKSNPSDLEKIYAVAKYAEGSEGYENAVRAFLSALAQLSRDYKSCSFEDPVYVSIEADYTVRKDAGGVSLQMAVEEVLAEYNPSQTERGPFVEIKNISDQLKGYYDSLKNVLDGYNSAVANEAATIRLKAKEFYTLLDDRSKNLDNAVSALQTVYEQLSDPNSSYNTKMTKWKTSAENITDNSMGKSNLDEIEELKKILNADEVNKLITRLTAAKKSVDDVKTEIAKFKFGGKSWKDFSDSVKTSDLFDQISAIKTQARAVVPHSSDAYDTHIQNAKAQVFQGNINTEWAQSEHPDLAGKDQVKLYTWLYNNYYDPNMDYGSATKADKTEQGEKELKSQKDSLKSTADGYNEQSEGSEKKTTQITDRNVTNYKEYLPSTEWPKLLKTLNKSADLSGLSKCGSEETDGGTMLSNTSSGTNTLLSKLMEAVGNMATTLRDDMYITDYIMTMFSYNTFETEKTVEGGGKLNAFSCWYETSQDGKEYTVKADYTDYAAKALSLTKNPINPKTSYLYGSEVEYIIYGNDDPTVNFAAAYATIFLLRFALNTVYAFSDAEVNNVTLAAATAVFGTPPLTPMVPIAKAAMIVGLSIAETAYDLYVLKSGQAVPLMKTNSTWMMKPSNAGKELLSEVASEVVEVAANAVIDEGYKVLTELIDKTDKELEEYINKSEKAIDNLGESVYKSARQAFYNYAHEAVDYAAELCRNANMAEMQEGTVRDAAGVIVGLGSTPEKVKLVTEGLQNWLAEQPQGDVIYEVKKAAVDYLTANNGAEIESLFNAMGNQGEGADKLINQTFDSLHTAAVRQVDNIAETAGSKLNDLREKTKSELEKAAKEGAESLRKKLKEQLNSSFGSSETGQAGSGGVVASLLSWSYSDYLTLLLLISTLANEEGVLLRMEDVIQLNMQHMKGEYASIVTTKTETVSRLFGLWKTQKTVETPEKNEKAYQLSKAYTYLQIDAIIEVKPLLMKIPFIADTVDKQLDGKRWYAVQYSGVLGY